MQTTANALSSGHVRAGRREWVGLAVLVLPILLVSMDMTVMYLAVPAVSKALKPSSSELLWISDIFGFFEAGFLITMGTLGDRIGSRRVLLYGGFAFALSSALAAFASTALVLICARALLGIAGATILPSVLSLIRNMFRDEKQRTLAISLFTTCFSAGTMLGPVIGGVLLDHFWWGSVFLIAVPLMILMLILVPMFLPDFKNDSANPFDIQSTACSIVATLFFIYGIKQIAEGGISIFRIIVLIAGILFAIIFVRRQQTAKYPLIDPLFFRIPGFNLALTAFLVAMFSWSGIVLLVAQYLQLGVGLNPFTAGLSNMPAAASSVIACMLAPAIARRLSRAYGMAAGLGLMALGICLLIFAGLQNLPLVIISMILLSGGCGITVTLTTDLILGLAPPEKAGSAASLSETSATFGAALGIALLGSAYTAFYRHNLIRSIPRNISTPAIESARNSLGEAIVTGQLLPHDSGLVLIAHAKNAFMSALHATAGICCVLALLMAAMVALRLKK